jgi:hypothetical protein
MDVVVVVAAVAVSWCDDDDGVELMDDSPAASVMRPVKKNERSVTIAPRHIVVAEMLTGTVGYE